MKHASLSSVPADPDAWRAAYTDALSESDVPSPDRETLAHALSWSRIAPTVVDLSPNGKYNVPTVYRWHRDLREAAKSAHTYIRQARFAKLHLRHNPGLLERLRSEDEDDLLDPSVTRWALRAFLGSERVIGRSLYLSTFTPLADRLGEKDGAPVDERLSELIAWLSTQQYELIEATRDRLPNGIGLAQASPVPELAPQRPPSSAYSALAQHTDAVIRTLSRHELGINAYRREHGLHVPEA